ncbi:MAG: WD40 repeat domain-containing protein [Nostoc sp. CreGUA01]|nr:hypothetical protein [Nostoc sp. CreGUA01]
MLNSAQFNPSVVQLHQLAQLDTGYGKQIAFSSDDRTWVSTNWGILHLWHDLTLEHSLRTPGESIDRVLFSTNHDQILASPHKFDVNTRQWHNLPSLAPNLTAELDTTPSGNFVTTGAVWSADGTELVVFAEHRASRRPGKTSQWRSPKGRLLLLNGNTRQLEQILWQGNGEIYRTIAVSDRAIVAAYTKIQVWDRQTHQLIATLPGHTAVVRDLRFSPDGKWLASVGADRNIFLWDTTHWTQAATWQAHEDDIWTVAFHPTLPAIATGAWDNQVKLWTFNGKLLKAETIGSHVEGLAFSATGDRLIVATSGSNAKLIVYTLEISP